MHSKPTLLSRLVWRLLAVLHRSKGIHIEGGVPDAPKYVLLGAPHTRNWDFVFFAGAVRELGIKPSFMGKHTLFKWPMRRFMLDMGGMPVNRARPGGYVRSVIEAFAEAETMALVIAPEGTRGSNGEWRTGFYHIAHGAGVPVVPAWVDYASKRGGIGEPLMPSGDLAADLAKLAAYYRSVMPESSRFKALEAQARRLAESPEE